MKSKKRILLTLIVLLASFAALAEEPTVVDIEFLSALIAPTKLNGKPWDGSSLSPNTRGVKALADMLAPGASVPVDTVISTVNAIAAQGPSAPDVVGYVVQVGPTTKALVPYAGIPLALATTRTKTQDSYMPRFYASYTGWPIFGDSKFQIQLWDKDRINDDQIGVVEITRNDVEAAIQAGKPTWINVSKQSMNQLLYILISASKSLPSSAPKMNGQRWP